MKLIKIFRFIYANSEQEIDTKNIGCHWTFWEDFKISDHSLSKKQGKFIFRLESWVEEIKINWDATFQSNRDYSHEYECVLMENQDVTITIDDNDCKISGSTGNRIDGWVSSCENFTDVEIQDFVSSLLDWCEFKNI